MKRSPLIAGLALALVLFGSARAEVASVAATPDITVTAPSRQKVPELLEAFAKPHSGDRLSRWRQSICPLVLGLTPDQNAYISAKITSIAKAARLPIAQAHCDPNIFILASSRDLADRQAIAKRAPGKLSDGRWPVDRVQVAEFTKADGLPVHTFYVTGEPSMYIGGPPLDDYTNTGVSADSSSILSNFGAPVIRAYASRLIPSVDAAITRTLVVVDGNRLRGISPDQLAAYLSMVCLAEVRVSQPLTDVSTITSLFMRTANGLMAPPGLTFWDRAYLGALYRAPSQSNLSMQRAVMAQRIRHAIDVLPPEPTPEAEAPPAAVTP